MLRDLGLLLLRLTTGTVLVGHGYTKLFGGQGKHAPEFLEDVYGPNFPSAVDQSGPMVFGKALEEMHVPAPALAAYASGMAEFGGGLAFVLGLKTRRAAPFVLFNLATAIRKVHWRKGMYGEGGFEFPLLLAAAAGTLLLTGPGAFSVDAVNHAAGRLRGDGDD